MTQFRTSIDGEGRRLELDGHNIARQVTGFTITATARSIPTITLHLIPGDLAVKFPDADVEIDAATRDLLERLGWTPPEAGQRYDETGEAV